MRDDQRAIEAAIRDCQQARASLAEHGGFRTRTLIDMLLIELKKELERLTPLDDSPNP